MKRTTKSFRPTLGIDGAKHFSEIVQTARELTTEIKCIESRREEMYRLLTNVLLPYQANKPTITVKIY